MAEASALPFFSTPAVARNAPPATKSFGATWQEVVTRVEAFGIEATEHKILEIDNYTHDETRNSLIEYYQNLTSHLFILLPGEYVHKVEVSYTEEVVTAVKLHTSKRATPWFGDCKGERQVFEAEEGFCINALRGKYGPDGCSELGVVFAPKDIAKEGHSAVELSEAIVSHVAVDHRPHSWVTKYLTWADAPRAIVITTTNTAVEKVRVVTAAEYDRIVRYPGSFEHAAKEQWFVLVEGERIKAVGVDIVDHRIKAVRFRTNLQTTQAFGTANRAEVGWLSEEDIPNSWICGFEFEATEESGEKPITTFGILTLLPGPQTTPINAETSATPVASIINVD